MTINFDQIDVGLVVNLATLREVLAKLSFDGRKWWIASDPADALTNRCVTIGHGDPRCEDRLNTLYYRVPVLSDEKPYGGTEKLIVLLDSSAVSPEQGGLYMEGGRLCTDELADIEAFLFPLLRALARMVGHS